jgi:hydrogenase-4 membrane subunit HyfE
VQLVSVAYCVLSFLAFQKVVKVAQQKHNGVQTKILWAVLSATFIGPFCVVVRPQDIHDAVTQPDTYSLPMLRCPQ